MNPAPPEACGSDCASRHLSYLQFHVVGMLLRAVEYGEGMVEVTVAYTVMDDASRLVGMWHDFHTHAETRGSPRSRFCAVLHRPPNSRPARSKSKALRCFGKNPSPQHFGALAKPPPLLRDAGCLLMAASSGGPAKARSRERPTYQSLATCGQALA